MFKLQQLQKLDEATLSRLVDRFAELDGGGTKGELVIGQEIPSAAQVEELQRRREAARRAGEQPLRSLQELWEEVKPQFAAADGPAADGVHSGGGAAATTFPRSGGGSDDTRKGEMDAIKEDALGEDLDLDLDLDLDDDETDSDGGKALEMVAGGGDSNLNLDDVKPIAPGSSLDGSTSSDSFTESESSSLFQSSSSTLTSSSSSSSSYSSSASSSASSSSYSRSSSRSSWMSRRQNSRPMRQPSLDRAIGD